MCPPTTLGRNATHSGTGRIAEEHLGHVCCDGSFEGFPTLSFIFNSMWRWEPAIYPCAFYQHFSCTWGRRSAGMYPGCHHDVTHWFQTTCSEASILFVSYHSLELLVCFQTQLFHVCMCGWYWKLAKLLCEFPNTWHLLCFWQKLATKL